MFRRRGADGLVGEPDGECAAEAADDQARRQVELCSSNPLSATRPVSSR